jgi:hypothetical protein
MSDNCSASLTEVDWGDLTVNTDTTHIYTTAGVYTVLVTVTDGSGNTAQCSDTVTVGESISFSLEGGCWHMITIPCEPFSTDPWLVFDELRPPAQPVDLLSGKLHRYDHASGGYKTYTQSNPSEFGDITPGDGYWLWTFYDVTIEYLACCPSGEVTVDYPTEGWYMTGYPKVITDLAVTSLTFRCGGSDYPFNTAVYNLISDPMFGYSCPILGYETVGIEPWDMTDEIHGFRGYWLYTYQSNVSLVAPAEPNQGSVRLNTQGRRIR